MEEQLKTKIEEQIKNVLEQDINMNNIEYLYKLSKIKHMMKEDENMNYGNYGRRPGYDSYGRYGEYGNYGNYGNYGDSYGRRGRDMKYRGHDYIDRVGNEYGRYMESRERYGASPETDKSFEYMVKSLEDFVKYLHEEAETPQQHQMLNETLQRSMR
jgi:hypothetical protein